MYAVCCIYVYVHMHAYICNLNMYACVAVRFCFYTLCWRVCACECVCMYDTKSRKSTNV